MAKFADGHECIVEGLLEAVRPYMIIIEPKRVLSDDITSIGVPDLVDSKNSILVLVFSNPCTELVDSLPNEGLKLSDCLFREPSIVRNLAIWEDWNERGPATFQNTYIGFRAPRRIRWRAWPEVVNVEPSLPNRPFIHAYLSALGRT
jgi:hypothetical protein